MEKLKTPIEWTVKTRFYRKTTVTNEYNFDRAVYFETPYAQLDLCWQPIEDSSSVQEKGEVPVSSYTAVIYDDIQLNKGDMVEIENLGYFLISAIKKYIHHRLVTVHSTDRRFNDVKG